MKLSKEDWDEMLHSNQALVAEPSSSTAPAAASSSGNVGGFVASIAKAAWGAAPIVGAALVKSRHPSARARHQFRAPTSSCVFFQPVSFI